MARIDELEYLAILTAACVHDFKHPGVNNTFLVKTHNPIAIRFNDLSVLENYHVSEAFKVLLEDE